MYSDKEKQEIRDHYHRQKPILREQIFKIINEELDRVLPEKMDNGLDLQISWMEKRNFPIKNKTPFDSFILINLANTISIISQGILESMKNIKGAETREYWPCDDGLKEFTKAN